MGNITISEDVLAAFAAAAGAPDIKVESDRPEFSSLSLKGSRFAITRGEGDSAVRTQLRGTDGTPVQYLDVVLLGATENVNKSYYADAYQEGSEAGPTCMSLDGKVPHASVENPPASNCASCPFNQWGSAPGNSKGKACKDLLWVALIPTDQKLLDHYGIIRLKISVTGLKPFSRYCQEVRRKTNNQLDFNMVKTRLSFDPDSTWPLLTYKAIGVLAGDEMTKIVPYLTSPAFEWITQRQELNANSPAPQPVPARPEPEPEPLLIAPAPAPVEAPEPVSTKAAAYGLVDL